MLQLHDMHEAARSIVVGSKAGHRDSAIDRGEDLFQELREELVASRYRAQERGGLRVGPGNRHGVPYRAVYTSRINYSRRCEA